VKEATAIPPFEPPPPLQALSVNMVTIAPKQAIIINLVRSEQLMTYPFRVGF